MGDASERSGQKTQDVTQKTAENLDKQTKRTREGTRGFDDFAQSMGTSEQEANAFRETIARVSPELGALMELSIKGQDIFSFLFSPIGAAAAGAIAAIALVTKALNDATEATERFEASQMRIKEATIDVQRSLSEELARLGKGQEETFGKATAVTKRLVDLGFEQPAAVRTAAAVVDEQGKMAVSEDELLKLTAGVQTGALALGGETPREQERALRGARRTIGRRPDYFKGSVQALTRMTQRQTQAVGELDVTAIKQYLEEVEKIQGEDLEQVAKDIREYAETQFVSPQGFFGTIKDWLVESGPLIFEATGLLQSERKTREQMAANILPSLQAWAKQRRGPGAPPLVPEAAVPAARPPVSMEPTLTPTPAAMPGLAPPVTRAPAPAPEPETAAMMAAGSIGEHAGATVIFNHGVQMFGKDNRNAQHQRIHNP